MGSNKVRVSLSAEEIVFDFKEVEVARQLNRYYNFQNLQTRFSLSRESLAGEQNAGFVDRLTVRALEDLLIEDVEKVARHLFSSHLFDFTESINLINEACRNLQSDPQLSLCLFGDSVKMRLKIEDNQLVVLPVFDDEVLSTHDFQRRLQDFCSKIRESVEPFMRYNIKLQNNRVMLEFTEVIDQMFYILKKFFRLPEVFGSKPLAKEALIEVSAFITKRTASSELPVLSNVVESSADHVLSRHRYVALRTFQFFNGLAQHGRLDQLEESDVKLLYDALTINGLFSKIPPIMLRSFNRLRKIVPFRSLESIVTSKKKTEYAF